MLEAMSGPSLAGMFPKDIYWDLSFLVDSNDQVGMVLQNINYENKC